MVVHGRPKTPKNTSFWGSPSPQGSHSRYILGDTTRPGHVTCVLVWSKSDQRRLTKNLHKQTDRQTNKTNRHYENNGHLAVNQLKSEQKMKLPSVWQVSVEGDRTSLEIDEVLMEDAGDYCVVARNVAGDARTSCHVDVIAASPRQPSPRQPADATATRFARETSEICPPGFTHVFQDFTVDVGQPCTVRVTVTGNPHPKVYCSFISPIFATQPVHRLQIRPIVHN